MIVHLFCVVLYLMTGLFVPCILHSEAFLKMVCRFRQFSLEFAFKVHLSLLSQSIQFRKVIFYYVLHIEF